MKITKSELKQIIKEELRKVMESPINDFRTTLSRNDPVAKLASWVDPELESAISYLRNNPPNAEEQAALLAHGVKAIPARMMKRFSDASDEDAAVYGAMGQKLAGQPGADIGRALGRIPSSREAAAVTRQAASELNPFYDPVTDTTSRFPGAAHTPQMVSLLKQMRGEEEIEETVRPRRTRKK